MMNIYHAQSGSNADSPVLAAPLSFVRSGFGTGPTGPYDGKEGYYMYSKPFGGVLMYNLVFSATRIIPYDFMGYTGVSLRCLAR